MSNQIDIARNEILQDLYRRFHEKDRSVFPLQPQNAHRWYKPQENYFSGSGIIQCPICHTGQLSYSRSNYNGHVHARCSTPTCVAWMERSTQTASNRDLEKAAAMTAWLMPNR